MLECAENPSLELREKYLLSDDDLQREREPDDQQGKYYKIIIYR